MTRGAVLHNSKGPSYGGICTHRPCSQPGLLDGVCPVWLHHLCPQSPPQSETFDLCNTATRGRARNWSQYNRSLVQQGSITFWIEKAAAKSWFADEKGTIGRPKLYADCAIVALMVIKVVFKCGFRQLEGLMRDVFRLMVIGVTCPSYSQICRRAQNIEIPLRAYRKGLYM